MEERSLLFFRTSCKTLLSSMQSLESSFFLIALRRFPHALSTCASAFEIAIQGAAIDLGKDNRLQALIQTARNNSTTICGFAQDRLDEFRTLRNKIVHRGFSPADNSAAVSLYLDIGFPLLAATYSDFHSFDLRDGLLQDFVEQFNLAQEVHQKAKSLLKHDLSYCLNAFGHLVQWRYKDNFSAQWEIDALIHAEEVGLKFQKTHKEKEALERLFGVSWFFDCPLCNEWQSVVIELNEDELRSGEIAAERMACTNCGFVVRKSHPFLTEALLGNQIAAVKGQILKEYGIT